MTGREERVLSGYQAISGQMRPDEDGYKAGTQVTSMMKGPLKKRIPGFFLSYNPF